ncbi:SRPBCC family protein [Rhizobium sp.]
MFTARHEKVSHRIALPLPADEALELFTPEGERLWIAEWRPRYQYPANGETMEGMVFTTGEGDELTHWTLVDFDIVGHRVRYARVTPGSRSTIVEVVCIPGGDHQCHVEVTYTLTGLNDAGNTQIEAFIGEAYVAMIEDWRAKILDHLERSPHRVFGGAV